MSVIRRYPFEMNTGPGPAPAETTVQVPFKFSSRLSAGSDDDREEIEFSGLPRSITIAGFVQPAITSAASHSIEMCKKRFIAIHILPTGDEMRAGLQKVDLSRHSSE